MENLKSVPKPKNIKVHLIINAPVCRASSCTSKRPAIATECTPPTNGGHDGRSRYVKLTGGRTYVLIAGRHVAGS